MTQRRGPAGSGDSATVGDVLLDGRTQELLRLAAAVATGDEEGIAATCREANARGVPVEWVDELALQSVLMVGYPRALVALGIWRRETGIDAPPSDPSSGESLDQWEARGEETCEVIYGPNYGKLRRNVRELHPALDRWMITEGYGRVISRPGLDLARRELCTVAQLVVLGAPRQLHSHLRGARNAGASDRDIEGAIALSAGFAEPEAATVAVRTWEAMR